MKKIISVVLISILIISALSACGTSSSAKQEAEKKAQAETQAEAAADADASKAAPQAEADAHEVAPQEEADAPEKEPQAEADTPEEEPQADAQTETDAPADADVAKEDPPADAASKNSLIEALTGGAGSAPQPLYILSWLYYSESLEDTLYCTRSNESILLLDEAAEAYPELNDALSDINSEIFDNAVQQHEMNLSGASSFLSESSGSVDYYPTGEVRMEIHPVRCDTKVLSFYNETYVFPPGAAHGHTVYKGYNLEPGTGRAIRLKDVVKDIPSLVVPVSQNLRALWDGSGVKDEQGLLADIFSGDESRLVWVIDSEGITFIFAPGEISYYAMGTITASLSFADYASLFTGKFKPSAGGYVRELQPFSKITLDLDGNGTKTVISLNGTPIEEDNPYAYTTAEVQVNGRSCSIEEYFYGMDANLVHTENGRNYIYMVTGSDNDYATLHVFDITGGTPTAVGSLPGTGFGSYYEPGTGDTFSTKILPMLDPSHFVLGTRMNLMSTYTAIRLYETGSDGMPVPLTDYYEIPSGNTLTSLVPLQVEIVDVQTGAGTGRMTELPEKTKCRLWRTNGTDTVDLMLENGTAVRVNVDKEAGWPQTVNGIELNEAFEGTMFAG